MKQKIAMFGGTFNPIHNGHLNLVRQFQEQMHFDRILLIPTSVPPHKPDDGLISGEHRLAMCHIAARPYPFLQVCDLEIKRGGSSYTWQTLEQLGQVYPRAEIFLLVGSDMFLTVEHWVKPERIFQLCTICAGARNMDEFAVLKQHAQLLFSQYGAKTQVLDLKVLPLSSTEIRQRIREGKSIDQLVPAEVEEYIRREGIYR